MRTLCYCLLFRHCAHLLRYLVSLPTLCHIDTPTQSLEVVWPQPPAPCPLRPATNRTTFLPDSFYRDSLTEGLNTTLWSNFTYGTARLGNTADTCGQALYGNGSLILGPRSYRKLQPMTVPANATISVHVLLVCDIYGSGVTVVLEYSYDDEATWFEAWSSRTLALGEWRRYEFSLPLEGDAFVHLRFRRPADSARYALVALDLLVSMYGRKGGKSCLWFGFVVRACSGAAYLGHKARCHRIQYQLTQLCAYMRPCCEGPARGVMQSCQQPYADRQA